jgi:hypothetical protein
MPLFCDPNKRFEEWNKLNYEVESNGLTKAVFYQLMTRSLYIFTPNMAGKMFLETFF